MIVYRMLREALAADGFERSGSAGVECALSPRIVASLGFEKSRAYRPAVAEPKPWIVSVQAAIRHDGYDPDEAASQTTGPWVGFFVCPGVAELSNATRPGDLDATGAWAEMFAGHRTFAAGVASILAKLRRQAIPLLHAHDTFEAIEATLHRGTIVMPATGRPEMATLTLGIDADAEGFGEALIRFGRKSPR